jgi:hypothetical protein
MIALESFFESIDLGNENSWGLMVTISLEASWWVKRNQTAKLLQLINMFEIVLVTIPPYSSNSANDAKKLVLSF